MLSDVTLAELKEFSGAARRLYAAYALPGCTWVLIDVLGLDMGTLTSVPVLRGVFDSEGYYQYKYDANGKRMLDNGELVLRFVPWTTEQRAAVQEWLPLMQEELNYHFEVVEQIRRERNNA